MRQKGRVGKNELTDSLHGVSSLQSQNTHLGDIDEIDDGVILHELGDRIEDLIHLFLGREKERGVGGKRGEDLIHLCFGREKEDGASSTGERNRGREVATQKTPSGRVRGSAKDVQRRRLSDETFVFGSEACIGRHARVFVDARGCVCVCVCVCVRVCVCVCVCACVEDMPA